MLFSTPQRRRASSASFGRTSAVMISSGAPLPVTSGTPSKLTIMPSPMELNTPSVPAMQTLAVYIRFENALLWLLTCQACRIGAV